jgi:hypothetical protein
VGKCFFHCPVAALLSSLCDCLDLLLLCSCFPVFIKPSLTDAQICDNVLLLLLAGHDTSSTTLTQCFSNLQDSPHVLDKLRTEQQALVAKHGEHITPAVLKEMVYGDAVIR